MSHDVADGHHAIREIGLRGILSFGPDTEPLACAPLNVFIGPNGSGKSNVIEAIDLMRSSPDRLTAPLRGSGGGVSQWIWKGRPDGEARVEVVLRSRDPNRVDLRHRIDFTSAAGRFELVDEAIELANAASGYERPYFFYDYQRGRPAINVRDGSERNLKREDVEPDESILSQREDPDQFPELAYVARVYDSTRIYREWEFGRRSIFRAPQQADLPTDHLEEDFSNLGMYLNALRQSPQVKRQILEGIRELYDGIDDFDVRVQGGTVEVFLTEGDFVIPASRLSDGTLRYLCLLAILLDPDPPQVICIEEPELGLHPDMLPQIARLLISASERCQLFVTTHSDVIVDVLSDEPESVVVVEKHDGCTRMRRLEATDQLAGWLESYRLGELWTRGELGGTRW